MMNNSKIISFIKRSIDIKIKAYIKNKTEGKKSAYSLIKLFEKNFKQELNEISKLSKKFKGQ